ncbi:hypothetical protein AB7M39_003210 [Bradyrhizobium diazoefficiens]
MDETHSGIDLDELDREVGDFCRFFELMPRDPAAAMHRTASQMHALCCALARLPAPAWNSPNIQRLLAPARHLHARSSFVRRLQEWPRGYPGDFETVELLAAGASLPTTADPGRLDRMARTQYRHRATASKQDLVAVPQDVRHDAGAHPLDWVWRRCRLPDRTTSIYGIHGRSRGSRQASPGSRRRATEPLLRCSHRVRRRETGDPTGPGRRPVRCRRLRLPVRLPRRPNDHLHSGGIAPPPSEGRWLDRLHQYRRRESVSRVDGGHRRLEAGSSLRAGTSENRDGGRFRSPRFFRPTGPDRLNSPCRTQRPVAPWQAPGSCRAMPCPDLCCPRSRLR